ncbi:unnamed protein product [Nippostrongylus brasiliensis]|uniref:Protein arginine N-methyltransferase 7 (inferred by orthology to a C. elegans protein) n=1 Tax=Nippostrongylus brasiliensis TaxID=27835 RepID=A0A0N4XD93_NIPBR|nr:unnamed protein product [Nippostrongylus brasiliensis]
MFLEKINNVTGEREWEVAEEEYDLAQEIARSRFADMILDYNRNDMFLAGLRTVIQEKKEQGVPSYVLDIGTGTGLLSLMAAREGADKVTAVEVFQPMAECAQAITKASKWSDKIEVIASRSTELTPLSAKPNIIVAEVFDTELIGEGALRTFKEALASHVQPACRVVPSLARVWILPVESAFLSKFNRVPRIGAECPLDNCPGTSAVFDVQLSQVKPHLFKQLSEPILAFSFNFESEESIIYDESFDRAITCVDSGQVDAILMWWDLDMDGIGKHWIDMAPKWACNDYHWRDHWMQAVYYLPQRVRVEKGETLSLKCNHDEFSMWFAVGKDFERIYCNCQMHTIVTRQSIFAMNELLEDERFRDEVKSVGRRVVVLGEGSVLFLLVAPVASVVTVVDSNPHFRRIIGKLVDFVISLWNWHHDVVVGEPFYLSAMTPWQNLRFWYDVAALRERFGDHIEIQPQSGVLYGICEAFTHLQNTGAPVGVVNGFDLSLFDDLSQKARQATDALVDIHPLWEYDGVISGEKFELLQFDLRREPHDQPCFALYFCFLKVLLLFIIFIDFFSPGEVPEWKEGVRQGVYLLSPALLQKSSINVDARFARGAGEVHLQFY